MKCFISNLARLISHVVDGKIKDFYAGMYFDLDKDIRWQEWWDKSTNIIGVDKGKYCEKYPYNLRQSSENSF